MFGMNLVSEDSNRMKLECLEIERILLLLHGEIPKVRSFKEGTFIMLVQVRTMPWPRKARSYFASGLPSSSLSSNRRVGDLLVRFSCRTVLEEQPKCSR
jgi:hypothetical protein